MARQTFQSWLLRLVFLGLGFVVLGAVFGWLIPERKPYGFDHPNRVLTAEVLLSTLDEKTNWWEREFRPTFLPESELELVESELKSRFPIQSLRQRLSFQNSHPAPVVRRIVVREDSKGVQDGFFSLRARALADLHSEEVDEFINRAGQGLTRSPRPEPAHLRLWDRYAKSLDSESVDSMILGEELLSLEGKFAVVDFNVHDRDLKLSENGMPRKEMVAAFHRNVEDGFATADSLGFVENIDKTSGFEPHQIRLLETWDGFLRPNANMNDTV